MSNKISAKHSLRFRTDRRMAAIACYQRVGFSLMELMVVIVIIGMMAAAVAAAVGGMMGTARNKLAKTEIATISDGVETFHMLKARYPNQEEGLDILFKPIGEFKSGILKKKTLNDPWGSPYQYIVISEGEQPFEVLSSGPDRKAGSADDISSLNLEKGENL